MNKFNQLGQAIALLESKRIIIVKNLLRKYNPQNTDDGFLYHAEKSLELSNEVTQLLIQNNIKGFELPLLSIEDLANYSHKGINEKFAFFTGYNSKSLELINKITASDMGKLGDKKGKVGPKIKIDTPEAEANRERVRKSRDKNK